MDYERAMWHMENLDRMQTEDSRLMAEACGVAFGGGDVAKRFWSGSPWPSATEDTGDKMKRAKEEALARGRAKREGKD